MSTFSSFEEESKEFLESFSVNKNVIYKGLETIHDVQLDN